MRPEINALNKMGGILGTIAKLNNMEEISDHLLQMNMPLSEFSSGKINQTELISLLIIQGKDFVSGIENVHDTVKGSCTMLLLTEDPFVTSFYFALSA